jgi:HAD superfamily hydrolase (TIGR01509 family)
MTKTAVSEAAAIIFDVDGTLVDSVDFHAEAWRRTFAAFGRDVGFRDVGFEEIRAQIGKGGDQLMPVFLEPAQLESEGEKIEAFRGDLFRRDYLNRVRGFPDVRALFETLLDRGVLIALGSSAKGEELQIYKKAAGIEDLQLLEVTSEDADNSKPHPDIFNTALARLGAPASRAIVVGDSPYDAEAAGKANVKAIGLRCGGFDDASLRKAGMSEIFDDPSHLLRTITASA